MTETEKIRREIDKFKKQALENENINRRHHIIKNTIYITLCVVFLLLIVNLFFFRTEGGLTVAGYRFYFVKTGSMAPEIQPHTLIVGKAPENGYQLQVGDIITYNQNGTRITHRIAQCINYGTPDLKYVTKGDANPSPDAQPISPSQIESVYLAKIPVVGLFLSLFQSAWGIGVFVAILGINVLFELSNKKRMGIVHSFVDKNEIKKLREKLAAQRELAPDSGAVSIWEGENFKNSSRPICKLEESQKSYLSQLLDILLQKYDNQGPNGKKENLGGVMVNGVISGFPGNEKTEKEEAVRMEGLFSEETRTQDPEDYVLKDIHLLIRQGDIYGILARRSEEVHLLLEIMGNIRPYGGGICCLLNWGMMRKKRVVLPHVFYIGDSRMLFPNMQVMEYLMMIMSIASPLDSIDNLEVLCDIFQILGMCNMITTPIGNLDEDEKMMLLVLTTLFSDSRLIIVNAPEVVYKKPCIKAMGILFKLLSEQGKTVVVGSLQGDFIQGSCTHNAFLAKGRIFSEGLVADNLKRYDQRVCHIESLTPQKVKNELGKLLLRADIIVSGHFVDVIAPDTTYRQVLFQVMQNKIPVLSVTQTEKSLDFALSEVMRQHESQKDLLFKRN